MSTSRRSTMRALRRSIKPGSTTTSSCVRDQELEIHDFLRYSRRFGPVVPHPSKSTRHPEIPEITMLGINKFDADGKLNDAIYRRGAEGWHTDGAYNQQPFKATQLYALAVPSRGGDTLFANGYAAYDALPRAAEAAARRRDGRLLLWRPPRRVAAARQGGPGLEAGVSSDHPHPSRNRPQIALFRSRQDRRHRRLRAQRRATR